MSKIYKIGLQLYLKFIGILATAALQKATVTKHG